MARDFTSLLRDCWSRRRFLCVGLDSDNQRLPPGVYASWNRTNAHIDFNQRVISATTDIAGMFMANLGYYEDRGEAGAKVLSETVDYIRRTSRASVVILDAQRADSEGANHGYARHAFDRLEVDAITVQHFLGKEAMKPFLDRGDKGVIVTCRTSKSGAGEFQGRLVSPTPQEAERWGLDCTLSAQEQRALKRYFPSGIIMPLFELIAYRVAHDWNYNGNCGIAVGAICTRDLAKIRSVIGDLPILMLDVDARTRAGEASLCAAAGLLGHGIICNSSEIVFAHEDDDEFGSHEFDHAARKAAQRMHRAITAALPREA